MEQQYQTTAAPWLLLLTKPTTVYANQQPPCLICGNYERGLVIIGTQGNKFEQRNSYGILNEVNKTNNSIVLPVHFKSYCRRVQCGSYSHLPESASRLDLASATRYSDWSTKTIHNNKPTVKVHIMHV